jgi:hypothetical protein
MVSRHGMSSLRASPRGRDRRSQSDLSESLVTTFLNVMENWFWKGLPKLCVKMGLGKSSSTELTREEARIQLKEALHSPKASLHLESMLKEFNKGRPKKDAGATWAHWKRGSQEIAIALAHAGFQCDKKGSLVGPPCLPSHLEKELKALDPKLKVKEALREAGVHLQSFGPFDAKTAGDLLRATMEVIHRVLVQELERLTNEKYNGHDKDNERRAYMRKVDFISEHEERVSTAIYSLISVESSHQLLARTDIVLFVQSTVHNYLILLLRRVKTMKKHLRRGIKP